MATFFTQVFGRKSTVKCPQGTNSQGVGLESPSMAIGRVLSPVYSIDCSRDLLDRYVQANKGKLDKQLANEIFQLSRSAIPLRLEDAVFTRQEA